MTVLFGPDGRDLIVQQIHEPPELGGPPSLLHRYDGTTGRPDASPVRVGRHETFLMSSPRDRRTVFVTSESDDETYMFAADGLRLLRRWPVGAYAGTVSPDGRTFALGSQDGAVRLLDLATGLVRRLAGGHEARVLRMRFSADGRTLVTSGEDGAVRAWDVQRGEVRRVFAGHALGVVWGADIVPDGRTVYSAGQDKRAFAWDLDGDRSLVRPFDVDRAFVPDDGDTLPRGLALAPDGRTLAVGHSDGGVDLIEADTLRTGARFRALRGFVAALAFSPDRNVLAATGQHGELALWDARPLRRLGELRGQRTTSQALAFSPDGTLLAAGDLGTPNSDYSVYTGGGVRVFDLRRRVATKFWPRLTLVSLAFSPDGRLLAMAAMESFTQIRDLRSGRLVTTLSTGEADRSVVFSPDGRLVLTGLYDGTAHVWSTDTWKPVGRPIEGHDDNRVLWMGFTPDGTMLATGHGGAGRNDRARRRCRTPPDRHAADRRAGQQSRDGDVARRAPSVRSVVRARRGPVDDRPGGVEAARLPRGRARADASRMERRAPGPAVSPGLQRLDRADGDPGLRVVHIALRVPQRRLVLGLRRR